MKADSCGTYTEQLRYKMGWKAPRQVRPRWQPIVQHPELNRQKLLGLTGHRSAGSITACRRRMRQVGLLR